MRVNALSIGPIPEEHSLFGYASGNAGAAAEDYVTMYIDDNGHHYIFYAGEDDKRATLFETLNDGTIRLKWTINSFTEDGVTSEINTIESSEFYLLFLQDFNLNDTIEAGELKKLHILIN